MTDPYVTLGVSPSASDDEIKTAYRNLAKKYHPDNYTDSPLSDMASEKMKEINEAYDAIQSQRRQGNAGGGYSNSYTAQGSSRFRDVRMFIKNGRIADADQILSGIPVTGRDAEWYFLKGTILYRKGWTEEAYSHFQTACNMDPGNMEYRGALNQVNSRRTGNYGGYNTTNVNNAGCSGCDICSGLCCADCCCECMGGDLIPCC
ncbi:MAG TPA: DnaJ domain-containing protein [Clostridiales bacterium]|nr:DnaJ domain-containing protein [Clostridiales bacterium]